MGPKEALNGGGRTLCSQFAQITGKFPFNPNSTQDAPVDQVNALLAPNTGELWKFYTANGGQRAGRTKNSADNYHTSFRINIQWRRAKCVGI